MNFKLIILYSCLSILTIAVRVILIKYIKEKAIDKQWVSDQIKIDLCIISGGIVIGNAFAIIVRELIGPFQSTTIVTSLVLAEQCSLDVLQVCILSLQLMQILNIFCSEVVAEWSEDLVIKVHRIIVISVGALSGCLACGLGGGFCVPSPFFLYLLEEDSETKVKFESTHVNVISSISFLAIILTCQVIVEVKRFVANRAEERADEVAVTAVRQLEEALSQHATRSQQSPLQRLEIRSAWEENSIRHFELCETPAIIQTFGKPNREQAVHVARIIFLIGIIGTSLLVFAVLFDRLNQYRPHGVIFSLCFVYGVIITFVIIISNQRIRQFSLQLIQKSLSAQFQ
jgi:hypothetical protein